jgi:hypothetical protein
MANLDNVHSTLAAMVKEMEKLPQVDCPVNHYFADGQYIRETHMPAGTVAIGKKHRYSTVNILQKGKIALFMGIGVAPKIISAPHIWVSDAGVQKAAYFLEDTIWLNAHPTEETDLEKIEALFIETKEIEWDG